MLAGREVTLHSGLLPRRTAVVGAALALDRQHQVRVGVEAANVQRVPPRTLQQSMVVAEVVPGQPLQVLDLLVEVLAGVEAQLQRPVQVFGPVMAVLVAEVVGASRLETAHLVVEMVARVLGRHPGLLSGLVALVVVLVALVPLLLPADCSVRVAGVVVAVLRVLVVQVVRAVAAQVAVVARVAAAHTQQVLVGLAALAGSWFWSFDHAEICRC